MANNNGFKHLQTGHLQQVVGSLTPQRLGKYLAATNNDPRQALRLYVLNTQISSALLSDLHYVEVVLRNKFDVELTAGFGATWFDDPVFLALMNPRSQGIISKAKRDAKKHWPRGMALPPGKVIAELMFGFWLNLTDSSLEHRLWVPHLHKAFRPRTAPKRSEFNHKLERLRQLRNRIAHHEPIFHMDLIALHRTLIEVVALLCPTTATFLSATSSVRREIMSVASYRRRKGV